LSVSSPSAAMGADIELFAPAQDARPDRGGAGCLHLDGRRGYADCVGEQGGGCPARHAGEPSEDTEQGDREAAPQFRCCRVEHDRAGVVVAVGADGRAGPGVVGAVALGAADRAAVGDGGSGGRHWSRSSRSPKLMPPRNRLDRLGAQFSSVDKGGHESSG
jgi:hypothetical protein